MNRADRRERRRQIALDVKDGMAIADVMKKYAVKRPMVSTCIKEMEAETGEPITRRRASRSGLKQKFDRGYITVIWQMAVPATCATTGMPDNEHKSLINWSPTLDSLRAACEASHVKIVAQSFGGFHSEDYKPSFNREPYLLLRNRLRVEAL